MSPGSIVLYCGFLLTVTAFSVDVTLPAFGLIAADLAADYGQVQLVVPLFILATGFGQMFAGPLSDRFGRKPVVLGGMALYAAGATICQFAPSIEVLLSGRILQGLGAAAGPVVGRAIIRDLFAGQALARNLALATMIFAFGPIVAPLLGISIMTVGSWRSIFFVITLFGLALLLIGWLALPESIPSKNPRATHPQTLWRNTKTAFANSQSRFFLIMSGPVMAMMIIILVSIPRVFRDTFGVEGAMFAILFAMHGIGIIIGQIVNRRMIPVLGTATAMKIGAAVLVITSFAMLTLHEAGLMSAYVLTGSMIGFATGYLVVVSNSTALALDPHGEIAGFVSSLYGFCAQLVASSAAIVIAGLVRGDLSAFIWVLLMLSGAVFTILMVGDPTRKRIEVSGPN